MELKVPSGRILWHFYIYLCSAWVVMLVVILWDWTEMKRVLSQIAYNIGLCSVESPVSFSPFSYNMTHCTFFSYCCWMHSAFYLRLLKKTIKRSQIQSKSNRTFRAALQLPLSSALSRSRPGKNLQNVHKRSKDTECEAFTFHWVLGGRGVWCGGRGGFKTPINTSPKPRAC